MTSVAASDAGNYKCTAVITVKPELKDEAMLSAEVICKVFKFLLLWEILKGCC